MKRNHKILFCCMLLLCSTMLPGISAETTSVPTGYPAGLRDGWELQWSKAFGGNGHAEFAQPFGDIDGDGTNEIILGGYEDSGICRIYYYNTTLKTYVEEYSWS